MIHIHNDAKQLENMDRMNNHSHHNTSGSIVSKLLAFHIVSVSFKIGGRCKKASVLAVSCKQRAKNTSSWHLWILDSTSQCEMCLKSRQPACQSASWSSSKPAEWMWHNVCEAHQKCVTANELTAKPVWTFFFFFSENERLKCFM